MKITSKSQLKKKEKFSLSKFKIPFCYKESKKYKIYEMPSFSSKFFNNVKIKDLKEKCLFISGPARSGNHLILSMLDEHPDLNFEVGEDDMLRTIFSHAKTNEKKTIKNIINYNFSYLTKLSGQPKFGRGMGVNKWQKLYKMSKKKNIKTKVWSGNQKENEAHITDFQDIVQKINYPNFIKSLKANKSKIKNCRNFLEFFDIYLSCKKELTSDNQLKKYKYRWCGSGLRRELFYLLKRSKKIICLTPIRRFENFYYSYSKTRHNTSKVNQLALNDLWEHWRHKVIDYLLLKKKYPNKIYLIKFEDLVNNPKLISKKICKILKIKYSHKMISPTVLGQKSYGNSSYKKSKDIEGKIYKSTINRNLKDVLLPKEYFSILKHIDKMAVKI